MLKAITSSLVTCLFFSGFAGIAMAQDTAEMQPLTKVTYLCDRNVELQAVYVNDLKNNESMAVLLIEGKLVPMRIWPAADGARYIALDEQDSYRWHSKGQEGTLTFLAADDSAKVQIVLNNCVSKDKPAE